MKNHNRAGWGEARATRIWTCPTLNSSQDLKSHTCLEPKRPATKPTYNRNRLRQVICLTCPFARCGKWVGSGRVELGCLQVEDTFYHLPHDMGWVIEVGYWVGFSGWDTFCHSDHLRVSLWWSVPVWLQVVAFLASRAKTCIGTVTSTKSIGAKRNFKLLYRVVLSSLFLSYWLWLSRLHNGKEDWWCNLAMQTVSA